MSFLILLFSFQRKYSFYSFLNKCCAISKPIYEVLFYHCTLSEGTWCFSHKYQHSYFSFLFIQSNPICVPASWRFVIWERSSPGAAHCSPLPAGAAGGRGREPFLCLTLPFGKVLAKPLEKRNKTLLYTTDCKGAKQTHLWALHREKYFIPSSQCNTTAGEDRC